MGMRGWLMQIAPQRLDEFRKNPMLAYDQVLSEMTSAHEGYETYAAESDSESSVMQKAFADFDVDAYRRNALAAMQLQNSRIPHPFPQEKLEESIDRVIAVWREQYKGGAGEEIRAKRTAKINTDLFALEKNWHVLHYALNGTAESGKGPLADAILGGSELRSHDRREEHGPLRYLTPQQVIETAAALAKVDAQGLVKRLDAGDAEAKQIYLAETLNDLESWSYLPQLFEKFRNFYADAAEKGSAMLLKIR